MHHDSILLLLLLCDCGVSIKNKIKIEHNELSVNNVKFSEDTCFGMCLLNPTQLINLRSRQSNSKLTKPNQFQQEGMAKITTRRNLTINESQCDREFVEILRDKFVVKNRFLTNKRHKKFSVVRNQRRKKLSV